MGVEIWPRTHSHLSSICVLLLWLITFPVNDSLEVESRIGILDRSGNATKTCSSGFKVFSPPSLPREIGSEARFRISSWKVSTGGSIKRIGGRDSFTFVHLAGNFSALQINITNSDYQKRLPPPSEDKFDLSRWKHTPGKSPSLFSSSHARINMQLIFRLQSSVQSVLGFVL